MRKAGRPNMMTAANAHRAHMWTDEENEEGRTRRKWVSVLISLGKRLLPPATVLVTLATACGSYNAQQGPYLQGVYHSRKAISRSLSMRNKNNMKRTLCG